MVVRVPVENKGQQRNLPRTTVEEQTIALARFATVAAVLRHNTSLELVLLDIKVELDDH